MCVCERDRVPWQLRQCHREWRMWQIWGCFVFFFKSIRPSSQSWTDAFVMKLLSRSTTHLSGVRINQLPNPKEVCRYEIHGKCDDQKWWEAVPAVKERYGRTEFEMSQQRVSSRTHTQISNMELSGRSSVVSGRNYTTHSTHIHAVCLLGFFIHIVI